MAASERIFELLDTHTEVRERAERRSRCRRSPTRSNSRDVGFGYEDGHGRNTLRGVSFTVRAGQMVAIVGRSGAGKTTLVNLLPRFYDVTGGAILIDGLDIREVTLASLRAQIGMVTQETVLFDDTIAGQHRLRRAGRARRSRSRRRRARRTRTTSSPRSRTATRRRSASAASGCRAASASGWRLPARCSRTRRS